MMLFSSPSRRGPAVLILLACCVLLVPSRPARGDDSERALAFLTFDRYFDTQEIGDALARIHRAWPERTRLASMGKSREGRDLWVMTVFDATSGDPDEKPAMYIDGNTHGNEVQAAEVCLYTLKFLLTRQDPWARQLLRDVTFHIAPTVNPDGRHRFFHEPGTPNGPRRVLRPVDDDRDGRVDEDPADDLDGDGLILRMRVKDPNGDLVVDERDDRLLRRRKPGERGQYRMLGLEGRDDDRDGAFNEDGVGGVDPNRNWPSSWRPEAYQSGAGPFPLSEPETRATAEWLLALPHLSGVQSYHNAGRMILRPPAAWTDREARVPVADRALYDEIARRGLQVLPTYRYLQIREDLYRVFGGFVEWTYQDLGVFSFTNELWGGIGGGGAKEEDPRIAALAWNDVALHGRGFVRWHDVAHPELGTVELGGWRRFTTRANPPDFLHDTCVRNCLFSLEHARALPKLVVRSVEGIDEGRALRVVVANDGMLPTIHGLARRAKSLPPDALEVAGAQVLAAIEERPGRRARVLTVRAGRVELPEGIAGMATRTLVLYVRVESEAKGVILSSRVGGVARGN